MNNPTNSLSSGKLRSLIRFFSRDVAALNGELGRLQREIDPQAVPKLHDEFHQRVLQAFEESQHACREFEDKHREDPGFVKDSQRGFLEETDPYFSLSWIGQRARTKPNGFVGDYEMLIKLYDEATPARGLGGYLDLCILDLPLARAVRTRLSGAREFLLREIQARMGKIRVLDVASGPCREYLDWPEFEDREVEVVAMDTDPQALDHVQTNVCPAMPSGTNLKPVRYNALRTSVAEATVRQFGKFDVIYSVGLCDYLTDDQLIRMFAAWKETLTEDGVMYVAFKDCEQYDHAPYQWHLDWFFYQRTASDALKLFEKAGLNVEAMEATRDATGIITNFIYRQSGAKRIRIDQAEQISAHTSQAPADAGVIAAK
jgi:extracellular factor (EF) 3-hydroxypalmitic acid methyl ester biosynthesis protein